MKKVLAYVSDPKNLKILIAIAVLFRLVLIPSPGFEADISFWKSWGLAVKDYGIVKGLPLTNFNYPTPFGYVLAIMAHVYSFFADPHNFDQYWSNTNLLFLAVAKAPSILADFGIFAIIIWIGRNAKRLNFPTLPLPFYYLLSTLYLLSPLPMFDGALWGQVDSLGVFIFLIANCFIWKKMPFWGGVFYMASMMTKLQNLIYGPVFFLFTWQYLGVSGLIKAVSGSLLAFTGLNIEFILARQMARVAGDLTGNYDYFPWLSLNAYNVWWIFAKAHGMQLSDKMSVIGIANAKTVGLYLFASTYLLACLQMLKGRFLNKSASEHQSIKASGPQSITASDSRRIDTLTLDAETVNPIISRELIFRYLTSLIIVCAGFFLFQTESHDRYAFPVAIFALLWAPFYIQSLGTMNHELRTKKFLIFYGIFTILFFYNIHNAMIANYPENGIPFLAFLNIPTLTIIASYLQIGLFFYFLYAVRAYITTQLFVVCVGVWIALIAMTNMSLILGKPVPITKLTPITSITGYGKRQVNMPVNASFGVDKWGFLSVQYAYYKYGIGTHAPSREVFDINKQFRKLSTDIGVDTNGGPQGSVIFSIYGDGKQLYQSEIIKRYEFPRHVEIDVTGIKILELSISDGGNGNFDDHANWLNTFLIP